ncbi:MAG: hypothetical protein HC906_12590 [Bacteroidales bacterium]|nr:hypothetical protein [Bacteroidales bacterium]
MNFDPNKIKIPLIVSLCSIKAINKHIRSFKCIYSDKEGYYWVGTDYGLFKLSKDRKKILHSFKHNPKDTNTLSIGGVCAIAEDLYGRLWVGTWGGGLNLFKPDKKSFKRFDQKDEGFLSPLFISNNSILCIAPDSDGKFWIGTLKDI